MCFQDDLLDFIFNLHLCSYLLQISLNFFLLRVDPFSEGMQNNFDRVTADESVFVVVQIGIQPALESQCLDQIVILNGASARQNLQ